MRPRIVSRHRRLPLPALVSVPFSRMELVTRDIVPLIDQLQRLLGLNQPPNGFGVNVYLVDRYS
jgi:hypothetical protein